VVSPDSIAVTNDSRAKRLIVGVSGASGAIYAVRLLEALNAARDVEVHLVMTPAAKQTLILETERTPAEVEQLADVVHRHRNIAASISSGSFPIDAMVVVPCSVRTAAAISSSLDDNLLVRAADVTLKERRPLVLALRESPLHLGHLRTLVQLAEMGATIAPLMPSFYPRPGSIAEIVDHTVGRILDQVPLPIRTDLVRRWHGAEQVSARQGEA
jgi:4-hydroxy-3-polyprenylbenzoate decarboxylase